jgi:hypothetical protein
LVDSGFDVSWTKAGRADPAKRWGHAQVNNNKWTSASTIPSHGPGLPFQRRPVLHHPASPHTSRAVSASTLAAWTISLMRT